MRIRVFVFLILSTVVRSLDAQELSIREHAWTAMSEKDYGRARTLLEKWLEADPGDAAAWYNLSSAYAMTRNKTKALDALERAIGNGFLDATLERLATMKREGVDVWLVHGIGDPSVPAGTSTTFAERLKGVGITPKLYIEEGDHSINALMTALARRWVSEVVKKTP